MKDVMQTDLPDPVVPATRRCGMRARSAMTGLPETSKPKARFSGEFDLVKALRLKDRL